MPFMLTKDRKRIPLDITTGKPIGQVAETTGMDVSDKNIFQQEQAPSVGGFASNILKSGWETAKGVGGAALNIFNPDIEKNTIANLLRLGVGGAELLIPGEQGAEKYARAVGQFYDDRYGISNLLKGDIAGTVEKTKKTVYEDPVGFALDASIILGGTGAVVKGIGTTGKISGLTKTGTAITKVGELVDPLRFAGGIVSKTLKPGEKAVKAGEIIERGGTKLGLRAVKAAPSDIVGFKELVGQALDNFQKENKLYGSSEQIISKTDDLLKSAQQDYNTLVRTGERVNIKEYTNMLRGYAKKITAGSVSPEIKDIADALVARAKFMEERAGKTGMITVDSLVQAKGEAFKKVTPATLKDAAALNANKIAGQFGLEFLDKYAPGSSAIGKRLQALREFRDIVSKRAGKGEGTQLFGIGRGGVIGATAAQVAGGLTGIPWLNMLTGAIVGEMVNAPTVISKASQALQKAGQFIKKTPELAEQAGGFAVPKAAVLSRLTPPTSTTEPVFEGGETAFTPVTETAPAGEMTPTAPSDFTTPITAVEPETKTATGYTLDELDRAMAIAVTQNKKNALKELKALYDIEKGFQERQGGGKQKPFTATQIRDINLADNGLRALEVVKEEIVNPKTGALDMGKVNRMRLTPGQIGSRKLYDAIFDATGARLRIESGAAINNEEIKRYVDNYFLRLFDSSDAVIYQIGQLEKFLTATRQQKQAATELQFQGGQPALGG